MSSYHSSPRAHLDGPPPKKMTDGELKLSADRLSAKKSRSTELPPLVDRKVLSEDVMKQSLDRLYINAITHKKKMMEDLDKKTHPDMVKHVALDPDTLQTAFQRLCHGEMEKKAKTLEVLKKKYLHENKNKKALSKDELAASANRLCTETMTSTKEKQEKLYEKYVTATAPKFPKLSKEKLRESADRLSSKK